MVRTSLNLHRLTLQALLLLCLGVASTASAKDCPSCGGSTPSEALSLGVALVTVGSLSTAAASGTVVVESVETVADGVVVVVKGSATAASATLKLSGKAVAGSAWVAGTVLEVSAVATGTLLSAAGKALAFIPNEAGQALLHHEQVQ